MRTNECRNHLRINPMLFMWHFHVFPLFVASTFHSTFFSFIRVNARIGLVHATGTAPYRTPTTGRGNMSQQKDSKGKMMAKDLIAGCFGGLGIVAVGHPFDTVKVHILFRRLLVTAVTLTACYPVGRGGLATFRANRHYPFIPQLLCTSPDPEPGQPHLLGNGRLCEEDHED